ncbi:LCP family protein [Heyndrickxia sp. NPDC080065]|uniref:LCP family protein n=1 Tax=Heyndrickxia sp. NPDC080065 TaxID=3390568 RepID=UPI003D04313F
MEYILKIEVKEVMMKKNKKSNSPTRSKGKKIKIPLIIISILLLAIVGVLSYAYLEYKQGYANSIKSSGLKKENIEFHGEEDKFGKINVLLLGIDSRGEKDSRTDTIMIAQYDPDTKKSKIISIMRDCYVEIPGFGSHRINAAYSYGKTDLLRKTITENFGISIEYVALMDFKGFSKTIDAAFPKGIEVDVEKEMSKGIGVTLSPGVQKLHGKELLGYVRFRKDGLSDWGRVERQQKVIKLLADNITSMKGIVKLPRMIGTVLPYIDTNMKPSLILSIATSFLSENNRSIETLRIPVDGAYKDVTIENAAVLDIDLSKNKEAIDEFLNH